MKVIIALAIGFYLGRESYLRYDRSRILEKEKEREDTVNQILKEHGLA